jgi:excisionase family DNA binding protein
MSITTGSDRIAYSVDEVAVRAGIGRDAVYDAIRERRLVARKWGRRTIITDSALRAFLDSLPECTLDHPSLDEETAATIGND